MSNLDDIMAYENGDLGYDEVLAMFQAMIDDGSVWTLQGSYGRTARMLIARGDCHARQ